MRITALAVFIMCMFWAMPVFAQNTDTVTKPKQPALYPKLREDNEQSRISIKEAVNGDLSYLLTGENSDIIKNSFTLNFAQPQASANFLIKLTPNKPRNYFEIINASDKESFLYTTDEESKKQTTWLKSSVLALQIKYSGGFNNNISSVFTNTKLNAKTSLQLGLVWILPSLQTFSHDQYVDLNTKFRKVTITVDKEYKSIKKRIAAYDELLKKYEESNINPPLNVNSYRDSVYKFSIIELRDSLSKQKESMRKDMSKIVIGAYDKVFDSYKPERKIFQWFYISTAPTYNENVRYTPKTDFNIAAIDTARYFTINNGISYNLMIIKEKALQSMYLSVKGSFSYSDNLQTATAIKIRTSDTTLTTTQNFTVYKPAFSADAYYAKDIAQKFNFNLSTTVIWYLDKARIVGFNPTLDVIAIPNRPVACNLTMGLVFSVPKSAGAISVNGDTKKSVFNLTPFIALRDLSQGQIDVASKFRFTNHVTFGLNFDVPFTIFGK